jgi:ribosomal protein S12 methylthiotransferase
VTRTRSFTLASLGCPKNRVDSERILAAMIGSEFAFTEQAEQADVIIVNTCAFIEPAVEESIDTILDYKAENDDAFLVVAGCLPLRYKEDLRDSLPEVNLFITPDQIDELPVLIRAATRAKNGELSDTINCHPNVREPKHEKSGAAGDLKLERPQIRLNPDERLSYRISGRETRILSTAGYAYLKISEGCSRKCAYCTIPSIRGPLKSTSQDDLLSEASYVASQGVRELVLVAQELNAYGREKGKKDALVQLLRRLDQVDGLRWIRLMYLHPDSIPADLPSVINNSDKILAYLDIPFQHISSRVLKSMGRPWRGDRIRKLVDKLRKEIPGLVLRTTFMIGFPTEGENEFRELAEFINTYDIERVGIFQYSPEEGTPAFEMGDPVPLELKQARANELESIFSLNLKKRNRKKVGRLMEALVEGISQESDLILQGRLWDQAPEIDGVLYVTEGQATAGEIHSIRITGTYKADFFGQIE